MINELPECYSEKTRKAARTHVCCECHGTIAIGEKYLCCSGIWDGEPSRYKVCLVCSDLRNKIDEDVRYADEKTAFGYLQESIFACGEKEIVRRFVENKKTRGATIPTWMNEEAPAAGKI